jgi:hypothetical protein
MMDHEIKFGPGTVEELNHLVAQLKAIGIDEATLLGLRKAVAELKKTEHKVSVEWDDKKLYNFRVNLEHALQKLPRSFKMEHVHYDPKDLRAILVSLDHLSQRLERVRLYKSDDVTKVQNAFKHMSDRLKETAEALKKTEHKVEHELTDKGRDNIILIIGTILVAALIYKAAPHVWTGIKRVSNKLYIRLRQLAKKDINKKHARKLIIQELKQLPDDKLLQLKTETKKLQRVVHTSAYIEKEADFWKSSDKATKWLRSKQNENPRAFALVAILTVLMASSSINYLMPLLGRLSKRAADSVKNAIKNFKTKKPGWEPGNPVGTEQDELERALYDEVKNLSLSEQQQLASILKQARGKQAAVDAAYIMQSRGEEHTANLILARKDLTTVLIRRQDGDYVVHDLGKTTVYENSDDVLKLFENSLVPVQLETLKGRLDQLAEAQEIRLIHDKKTRRYVLGALRHFKTPARLRIGPGVLRKDKEAMMWYTRIQRIRLLLINRQGLLWDSNSNQLLNDLDARLNSIAGKAPAQQHREHLKRLAVNYQRLGERVVLRWQAEKVWVVIGKAWADMGGLAEIWQQYPKDARHIISILQRVSDARDNLLKGESVEGFNFGGWKRFLIDSSRVLSTMKQVYKSKHDTLPQWKYAKAKQAALFGNKERRQFIKEQEPEIYSELIRKFKNRDTLHIIYKGIIAGYDRAVFNDDFWSFMPEAREFALLLRRRGIALPTPGSFDAVLNFDQWWKIFGKKLANAAMERVSIILTGVGLSAKTSQQFADQIVLQTPNKIKKLGTTQSHMNQVWKRLAVILKKASKQAALERWQKKHTASAQPAFKEESEDERESRQNKTMEAAMIITLFSSAVMLSMVPLAARFLSWLKVQNKPSYRKLKLWLKKMHNKGWRMGKPIPPLEKKELGAIINEMPAQEFVYLRRKLEKIYGRVAVYTQEAAF